MANTIRATIGGNIIKAKLANGGGGRSGKNYYSVTIGSSNADYIYNGTDISVAINQAITEAPISGVDIFLQAGTYTIANTISFKNKANLQLRGAGKMCIIQGSSLAITYFDIENSTTRYKFRLSDFTIDNTSATTGSIGFSFANLSDAYCDNLVVRNFETGYKLEDTMYYNVFIKCDTEDCNNGFTLTAGGTSQPNSNTFIGCKVLASASFINTQNALGTPKYVYPLTLNNGNQNSFMGCQFENFNRGIYVNDIGNTFTGNRVESNDVTGSSIHISLGSNAKNNQFVSNYYSGNDWVNKSSSIVDSGAGNTFIEGNNFKDQFVDSSRNALTASDFWTIKRTGSGDAKAVLTLEDTYSPSGSPIQLKLKGVRSTGKPISAELSGVEKFYVTAQGVGKFTGGLDASGVITNVTNPTNTTDGANKTYVDNPSFFLPNHYSIASWSYDPISAVSGSTPVGGTLYMIRLRLRVTTTITYGYLYCSTAGTGTTNAYCALYDTSGTLLAQSDDQSANMGSTGLKTFTFTPQNIPAGEYYLGFWATASTTVPSFLRATGSNVINSFLGSNYRYATADTGLTNTAPSPRGAMSASVFSWWCATA